MRYCLYVLEGRVEKIDILYQRYELSPDDPRVRVPVGGKLMPAEEARGYEKEEGDLKATGYLVVLSGCTVRPARKEEVTFR